MEKLILQKGKMLWLLNEFVVVVVFHSWHRQQYRSAHIFQFISYLFFDLERKTIVSEMIKNDCSFAS